MKIRHYSRRYLPEIRKRLKQIIQISHRNRLDSNEASSCELMADDIPHARQSYLDQARSIRSQIKDRDFEIEMHKNWIEKKAPGFFKRISFVSKHVTNWNLDMPAICFPPVRVKPLARRKYTQLTFGEREYSLERRRQIMNNWYCFFFGDDHLNNPLWNESD